MALIDVAVFPIIKHVHDSKISPYWLVLPILLYSIQPLIFYKALDYSNVATINIMWDIMSDVIVTLMAIYILREKVSDSSKIGIVFAMIALYFFSRGEVDK